MNKIKVEYSLRRKLEIVDLVDYTMYNISWSELSTEEQLEIRDSIYQRAIDDNVLGVEISSATKDDE